MSRRVIAVVIAALAVSFSSGLYGQAGQAFQFVVSALDDKGEPLTDIKAEEVLFAEKAGKGTVSKIEPFSLPVKVTIAVDNGDQSSEALPHYRAGLKGFVEAFPDGTEFTLLTTSPQPRMVVRPTTDRAAVLRGVNGFAPEMERPRFTDAMVEYSQRLQKEAKDPKVKLYVPILLMVSTASNESSSYQPAEVQKALEFMVARRVKLYVTINSTRSGDATATADLNTNRQAIIAVPATKALNGRFESIAIFNRLQTLLPEMGQELASYAKRLGTQHQVTVQRAAAGPMEELRIELARQGAKGSVSVDGYFPK